MRCVLELNAGAGGMALGLKRAGLDVRWAFDSDPDACASYEANVGHRPLQLDLHELLRLLESGIVHPSPVDLLIADPPCTPWSRAGAKKGLADLRDTLRVTFELIRRFRPSAFLLGNVPGLDDGPNLRHLQDLVALLEDRYAIDYRSLDAACFGTPQHRARPFWFGRRPSAPALTWPKATHGPAMRQLAITADETLLPFVTCRDALSALSPNELGRPCRLRKRSSHSKQHGSVPDKPARVVGTSNLSDGNVLLVHDRGAKAADSWPWDRPATTVCSRDELSSFGRNGRAGTSMSRGAVLLSERAGALLQGFPPEARFVGRTKRSRWSQIGQALPPQVGEALGRSLVRWFEACDREREQMLDRMP